MQIKVIGIKKVNYISKKTGKPVEGTQLFYNYKANDVEGCACDKLYLYKDFPNAEKIQVGKNYDVYFNQFGKPDLIAEV